LIRLQNVSKFYADTPAVEDLSFRIEEGETFGLIGTSGCGKTTTLKMINRLVEPTSGTLFVDGKDITTQNPHKMRRNIGYVIQDVGLFPHYTVEQNISTVPKLLEWDQRRIESRIEELLEMVGLSPGTFAHRLPESLSGGQQQRVGLARALAADPKIILLDEPFGALDPITKRQIRAEANELFNQINKTIVLVTHDVQEALEMCDRLCLLDNGHAQQIGTPQELLFDPANDFVDSFFASGRFQLELLSVTISDIVEVKQQSELYWSPPSEESQDDNIRAELSLYEILEIMEQRQHDNVVIIHRAAGQVIDALSFTDVLNRFQSYKKELKTGGDHG